MAGTRSYWPGLRLLRCATWLSCHLLPCAAQAIMDGFKSLIPKKCKVIRDGAANILDAVELVPGDVVEFQVGVGGAQWGRGLAWARVQGSAKETCCRVKPCEMWPRSTGLPWTV